jgi:ferritin
VAFVSTQTGIAKDRIYKWIQGKAQPKAYDTQKLVEFLNDPDLPLTNPAEADYQSKYLESVEKQNRLLEQENARLARIVSSELSALSRNQDTALLFARTVLEEFADLKALVLKKPVKDVREAINKKLSGGLPVGKDG